MKSIFKTIKNKKKAIASFALAAALSLSFNYAPINVLNNYISTMVSAYKSESVKNYFPTNQTSSDNNFVADYPLFLDEYFSEDSGNNFNIKKYYETRFNEELSIAFESMVTSKNNEVAGTSKKYSTAYSEWLNSVGYENILNYYNNNKTSASISKVSNSFKSFIEYFVLNGDFAKYTNGSDTITLPALYQSNDKNTNLTAFYKDLATALKLTVIEDDGISSETTNFYDDSVNYKNVKNHIDNIIEKTVAIYNYDGKTSDKTIAGIVANNAPNSSSFYYTSSYETIKAVNADYEKDSKNENKMVYYFGESTFGDNTNSKSIENESAYDSKYFAPTQNISVRDADPLSYYPITDTKDPGYINGYVTYHKYNNIPYVVSASFSNNYIFELFIVNANPTADEKATYKSCHITPITETELNTNSDFYVKVPYNNSTEGEEYFKKIFGASGLTYENFVKLCTSNNESKIYFKLSPSEIKKVYLIGDVDDKTQFESYIKNHDYQYAEYYNSADNFINKNDSNLNLSDYYRIPSGDKENYSVSGYSLYFKKEKVNYSEFITTSNAYDGYETKASPAVEYEKTNVPADTYERVSDGRKVYVLDTEGKLEFDTDNKAIYNGKTVYKLTTDDLNKAENRNRFIKVPSEVSEILNGEDGKFAFYYSHNLKEVNKVYMLVEDKNFDAACNNEVYKTLNYTILKESDYKADFSNFTKVNPSDDKSNLYYRYANNSDLFVKNLLRESENSSGINKTENAVFIVADNPSEEQKITYRRNNYTVITSNEFKAESEFYVKITKNDADGNYVEGRELYYKYSANTDVKKVIYTTSTSNNAYPSINTKADDYVPEDYELVQPTDKENYVEGQSLYYKKIRKAGSTIDKPRDSYYNLTTNKEIKLNAKSYYAVSFYAYTSYDSARTNNPTASFYIKDTAKAIEDISITNISTNGKWVKYIAFIATNTLTASNIKLTLSMGTEDKLCTESSVTGSVLFDNIKVTLINETDFNNKSIDGKVDTYEHKDETSNETITEKNKDTYGNEVIIVNNIDKKSTFDNRNKINPNITTLAASSSTKFNDMVDFETISNLSLSNVNENININTPKNSLWQQYINYDYLKQGSTEKFDEIINSYKNKFSANIIDEADIFDKKPTDENTDDNVKYVKDTFNENNKILEINNKDSQRPLGLVSAGFTVSQHLYYKITVWVYSPDANAKARVGAVSYLKLDQSGDYLDELEATTTVNANLSDYTTTPSNEYGWIPATIYIEGNAFNDSICYLILEAENGCKVYFDNISIEATSSSDYSTNSNKDNSCGLTLSPDSSLTVTGIGNGDFSTVNVTDNFSDNLVPRVAKKWNTKTTNSSNVIAGVIPTSKDYFNNNDGFFKKYTDLTNYNNSIAEDSFPYNIFAINAPNTIKTPIANSTDATNYNVTSTYAIYSSNSITVSANSVSKISFDFAKASNFNGNLVAKIYYGSVDNNKVLSSFIIDSNDIAANVWKNYSFYVATGPSSASVYLELGVSNATGSCFFGYASSSKETDSIDKIRDNLSSNLVEFTEFVNLKDSKFSMLTSAWDKEDPTNDTNPPIYNTSDYTFNSSYTDDYTVGKAGVVVAEYYKPNISYKYTVTINKVEYYLSEVEVEQEDGSKKMVAKLFSNSNCTPESEVTKIDGKKVTVTSLKKITVGTDATATEYSVNSTDNSTKIVETEVRDYKYYFTPENSTDFEEYIEINNNFIKKSDLNNAQSQNVLVLANGYSTDYTIATPNFNNSLRTSSYYVLKVYVKTSDFTESNFGLNINVKSISKSFKNINTTKLSSDQADKFGYVCYQFLIETNTSSVSSLSVTLSLGDEVNTGAGYALISGIELQTFATEKLFNEYAENYKDNTTTVERYVGTKKDSTNNPTNPTEPVQAATWATFFYIFSSLLLGIALIAALVAIFIKRHPIKSRKPKTNEHERDKASDESKIIDTSKSNDEKPKKKRTSDKGENPNGDEGFV